MNPEASFYGWGLPVQASSYAAEIDWLMYIIHIAMLLIFVLWTGYMIYCLIKFRKKEGVAAVYSHKTGIGSYVPDVAILVFDIWLIFIIGFPIWANIRENLPSPENSMEINIVAEQFAWNIHYPGEDGKFGRREPALINATNPLGLDEEDPYSRDDITTINVFHVPINMPVRVNLTSKDVIHSFFVPAFRMKQDAVPGMLFPIWFEATLKGKFEIGCAQLCGLGHYRMRGDVIVETQEEFDAWMKQMIRDKE